MACAFCNRFKSDRTPLEWVWQRAKAWPPEVHDRYWRYPVLGKPGKSRWVGFPLRMPPDVRAEVDRIAEADLTRPALNTVFLRLIRAGLDARDASAPDVDAET